MKEIYLDRRRTNQEMAKIIYDELLKNEQLTVRLITGLTESDHQSHGNQIYYNLINNFNSKILVYNLGYTLYFTLWKAKTESEKLFNPMIGYYSIMTPAEEKELKTRNQKEQKQEPMDREYNLYVGCTTYTGYKMSRQYVKNAINNIMSQWFASYSLIDIVGVYNMEPEETIIINFIGTVASESVLIKVCNMLKDELSQNSILLTSKEVKAELI